MIEASASERETAFDSATAAPGFTGMTETSSRVGGSWEGIVIPAAAIAAMGRDPISRLGPRPVVAIATAGVAAGAPGMTLEAESVTPFTTSPRAAQKATKITTTARAR